MTFPRKHVVDYTALLDDARLESPNHLAAYLRNHLPDHWRKSYISTAVRPTNIVRFPSGSFEYIFDIYSDLETAGEVAFDQTVEDRVVAVFGMSVCPPEARAGSRIRGWLGETGEIVGATRDRGHFIAHCIGGGLDLNVFSQGPQTQPRMVLPGENLSPDGKILPGTSRHFLLFTACLPRHLKRPAMAGIRAPERGRNPLG